jgi:hypothetical protein
MLAGHFTAARADGKRRGKVFRARWTLHIFICFLTDCGRLTVEMRRCVLLMCFEKMPQALHFSSQFCRGYQILRRIVNQKFRFCRFFC